MSDSYAITIEAIQGSVMRARVHLLNFQYPEVPANKCLALQISAEAAALADRADARLEAIDSALKVWHDDAFNQELIALAEAEILRVVELECENFDKTPDWHARNEAGSPDLPPFRDLGLSQLLELEVADPRWLEHLEVGARWETAMYARDERYSG